MLTFATEILDEVKEGRLTFYKLIIDGRCLYDEFCDEVEDNVQSKKHLNVIRTYMNLLAQSDCLLPKAKFNSIKKGGDIIGYEFKKDSLRVYVIKETPDVYVVLGGYKNTQKKDIERFAKIEKAFRYYNNSDL